jgi:hypothetical protein
MAEIFLCPKGTVSKADRKALRNDGIVVVEVERPNDCKFIRATSEVSDQALVWALLKALNHKGDYSNHGTEQRSVFVQALFDLAEKNREPVADPPRHAPPQERE